MLKYAHFGLLILILILIALCFERKSFHTDIVYGKNSKELYDFRTRVGDNVQWSWVNYEDTLWDRSIYKTGKWWLRAKVNLDSEELSLKHKGLFIAFLGSYDLYWDGNYIESNGTVGRNIQEEVPGTYHKIFLIPDTLSYNGIHHIALRISNFNLDNPLYTKPTMLVSEYTELYKNPLVFSGFIYLLGGLFLITSLYSFFIHFISFQHVTLLLFGFLCFCFFSLIILDFVKYWYQYPYTMNPIREEAMIVLTFMIALLLPLFFMNYFNFYKKKKAGLILGAVLSIILLVNYQALLWDPSHVAYYLISASFIISVCIISWAIIQKIPRSRYVFIMVVLCFFMFMYYDFLLYASFSILIIFMLFSLTIWLRMKRQEYEESVVRSSRLEIELLKKNIQPHFLMNTLTSLMEWLEEAPQQGVKMIEALAQEFDILINISGEKLIPVEQEIMLCKSHLKVMSFRKSNYYYMRTENIDPNEQVPPALFHTAIENGITHNLPTNKSISFTLKYAASDRYKTYSLFSSGKVQHKDKSTPTKDGTGLKYMKARLEESFPGKWELISRPVEEGWLTIIKIQQDTDQP